MISNSTLRSCSLLWSQYTSKRSTRSNTRFMAPFQILLRYGSGLRIVSSSLWPLCPSPQALKRRLKSSFVYSQATSGSLILQFSKQRLFRAGAPLSRNYSSTTCPTSSSNRVWLNVGDAQQPFMYLRTIYYWLCLLCLTVYEHSWLRVHITSEIQFPTNVHRYKDSDWGTTA